MNYCCKIKGNLSIASESQSWRKAFLPIQSSQEDQEIQLRVLCQFNFLKDDGLIVSPEVGVYPHLSFAPWSLMPVRSVIAGRPAGPSQWGWINSLFVNCSLAASWTTWRRFWMICRIVNYHSFSQTRGQAPLLDPSTSKPSSMTSCNSQLRTARSHLLEARKRRCGFHRAVSMRY